jgi:ABC-2 type transport system permease protein
VIFPLSDFGAGVHHLLELLPISALTDGLRTVLRDGNTAPLHDWLTLLAWATGSILVTSRTFRWS